MQIAQIQESESEVRWVHPDDVMECRNCQKNLKSIKEKVNSGCLTDAVFKLSAITQRAPHLTRSL